MKKIKIRISKEFGSVSALYNTNEDCKALLILSHGAGAGMTHSFMQYLSDALLKERIATLRFNFLYMENGGAPDRPKKAHAVISAAIKKAEKVAKGLPLFLSGKSFGGRMSSLLIAEHPVESIKGLIYFGFPLHAPGRDSIDRANHLKDIKIPQLFLQGTRDKLANLDLFKPLIKKIKSAKLEIINGGDHSFKMLKRSKISNEETIIVLAKKSAQFISKII